MKVIHFRLRCSLCGKVFNTISLRSFTNTMRRHRIKAHPEYKGKPIRYKSIGVMQGRRG